MTRLPPPLLALSPGGLVAGQLANFLRRVDEAVEAGLAGILLREAGLDDRVVLELARELRVRLDRDASAPGWLGVHDRGHVALAANADAVHVGFRSMRPHELRELLAPRRPALAIGLSAHQADDVRTWSDADYLFFGPVRPTASKRDVPDAPAATGFDGLAAAVRVAGRPVWALGGLGPADVEALRGAGAEGVAVLSGVFGAASVSDATRAYLAALGAAA